MVIVSCGLTGTVAARALTDGVGLRLPGAGLLRVGSEGYVLSDYSFQSGTTYFIDFKGYGLRGILEVQYLVDRDRVDVVFSAATRDAQNKHKLTSLPIR